MLVNTLLLLSIVSICLLSSSFGFTFPTKRTQSLHFASHLQPLYSKSYFKNSLPLTLTLNSVKNSDIHTFSTSPIDSFLQKIAISNMLLFSIVTSSMAVSSIDLAAVSDTSDNMAVLIFAKPVLDVFINVMNLLFLSRVIISWYPKTNKGESVSECSIFDCIHLLSMVNELVSVVWLLCSE